MQHVNDMLLPLLFLTEPHTTISKRTAQWWLWKLGYWSTESKKGTYVDGHEQPDVLAYWKTFIECISLAMGFGR